MFPSNREVVEAWLKISGDLRPLTWLERIIVYIYAKNDFSPQRTADFIINNRKKHLWRKSNGNNNR